MSSDNPLNRLKTSSLRFPETLSINRPDKTFLFSLLSLLSPYSRDSRPIRWLNHHKLFFSFFSSSFETHLCEQKEARMDLAQGGLYSESTGTELVTRGHRTLPSLCRAIYLNCEWWVEWRGWGREALSAPSDKLMQHYSLSVVCLGCAVLVMDFNTQ